MGMTIPKPQTATIRLASVHVEDEPFYSARKESYKRVPSGSGFTNSRD